MQLSESCKRRLSPVMVPGEGHVQAPTLNPSADFSMHSLIPTSHKHQGKATLPRVNSVSPGCQDQHYLLPYGNGHFSVESYHRSSLGIKGSLGFKEGNTIYLFLYKQSKGECKEK